MTRAELRQRVLDGLNDPEGVFVTASHAQEAVTEALEVWAEESDAIRRTAFVPLVPGTAHYWLSSVDPTAMQLDRLWLVSHNWRLDAVSMSELDRRHLSWPTVSGVPEVWYPVSWDCFGVWPWPAAGGGVLRVDYLAWPRALLDDDDEPETPLRDHDAFVDYGIYDGLLRRWETMPGLEAWGRFVARWRSRSDYSGRRDQARVMRRSPVESTDA